MNSIITNDGKYIGLYLHIKDNGFSVKMFTKFYNLATQNNSYSIDSDIVKGLIHSRKYKLSNKINQIYVNDPNSDNNILKSINIDDYMVFIHETNKLYVFNKDEFIAFMNINKYNTDKAITYIFGIDNGIEFDNMHIITANCFDNAKNIYINRYKCNDEPVCIGIIENDHLIILTDKHKFSLPMIM